MLKTLVNERDFNAIQMRVEYLQHTYYKQVGSENCLFRSSEMFTHKKMIKKFCDCKQILDIFHACNRMNCGCYFFYNRVSAIPLK